LAQGRGVENLGARFRGSNQGAPCVTTPVGGPPQGYFPPMCVYWGKRGDTLFNPVGECPLSLCGGDESQKGTKEGEKRPTGVRKSIAARTKHITKRAGGSQK